MTNFDRKRKDTGIAIIQNILRKKNLWNAEVYLDFVGKLQRIFLKLFQGAETFGVRVQTRYKVDSSDIPF